MKAKLFVISSVFFVTACGTATDLLDLASENGRGNSNTAQKTGDGPYLDGITSVNLIDIPTTVYEVTTEQKDAIAFLYEEELFAYNFYSELNTKYDVKVFERLALAEKHHLDAFDALLTKYQIAKPVGVDSGKYSTAELNSLYAEKITASQVSEESAAQVAQKLEEGALANLKAKSDTANEDVKFVIEKLLLASEKHLKALTSYATGECDGNGNGKMGSGNMEKKGQGKMGEGKMGQGKGKGKMGG